MSSSSKLRVALPFVDGAVRTESGWLAGFYYVRNCLNALASLPEEKRPEVAVLVPDTLDEPLLASGVTIAPWLERVDVPLAECSNDALEVLYRELGTDVVFPLTSVNSIVGGRATVGWIPDFQHRYFPEFFTPLELRTRELHYAFIAGWCDCIASSSAQVRSDFQAAFPGVGEKVELLPFAVTLPEDVFQQSPIETLERYGLRDRRYVYLPNQFWLHKNHATAFEAWRLLSEDDPEALLVCSGAQHDYRAPDYYPRLERFVLEHNLDGRILRLGVLDRTEQLQLMRGASCVLQPSLFEGWSTSVEEAKALGKKLVVSDIAVHREQCGTDAAYFPRHDPEVLARELRACLQPDSYAGYEPDREEAARQAYEPEVRRFGERLVGTLERAYSEYRAHPVWVRSRELMLGFVVDLQERLADVESDRGARLRDVNNLTAQLAEVEADRRARLDAVDALTATLTEVEADRAARLDALNVLTVRLQEAESDRAARLDAINVLTARLQEVELDRAARLDAINTLTARLEAVEADRAARLEAIDSLTRQLAASQTFAG